MFDCFLFTAGMNESTVFVIPSMVGSESIACVGEASMFNVTWQPSVEVNHGEVMYEVNIEAEGLDDVKVVSVLRLGRCTFIRMELIMSCFMFIFFLLFKLEVGRLLIRKGGGTVSVL